jgi:hypothetical protein
VTATNGGGHHDAKIGDGGLSMLGLISQWCWPSVVMDEGCTMLVGSCRSQWQDLCWYFLMNTEEFASVQKYRYSLHPEVFRVSYFPQGMEVLSPS